MTRQHTSFAFRLRRRKEDERGAYAVLMSLLLVLLVGLAALAVDIAAQTESKQRLRDTLDAAAHAAVQVLRPGSLGASEARAEAVRIARLGDPGANPVVTFWCVIGSDGANRNPITSQIPRTCAPDNVRQGPYDALRYPGMVCDEVYCFIPCSETDGSCNTVRVEDSRDVDFKFAPAIGFDKGGTGAQVTVACKGSCGTGQPRPIDLVIMADRTYSMYTNSSHASLNAMLNGIKSSLDVMDPTMHHVAFGAIHKSLGPNAANQCYTKAVPDPAYPTSNRPANWPIPAPPSKPVKNWGESNSSYNNRVAQWERDVEQWELQQGVWVAVPFSNDFKNQDGSLNTSSRLVRELECLRPASGTATNYYSPMKYRTHLSSALKGAGRYLLGYDGSNVNSMPSNRSGQRDHDGNLIDGAVMKVVMFETDGEPREPLSRAYSDITSSTDIGTGGENDAQKKLACQNFVRMATELKNKDITLIMIGFGDANRLTCGSSGGLVRDTLAAAASPHPATGQASDAEDCAPTRTVTTYDRYGRATTTTVDDTAQAAINTAKENSDGDFYFCAATGDDLADVFQAALSNLTSGVRLLRMPS